MMGYGAAGMLGLKPHVLAINVVARYIGIGPGGLARAEADSRALQRRWARMPAQPVMQTAVNQSIAQAQANNNKAMAEYQASVAAAHRKNARAMAGSMSTVGLAAGVMSGVIVFHTTKSAVAFDKFSQQLRANSAFQKGEFASMVSFSRDWAKRTGAHVEDVMTSYRRLTDVGIHFARARAFVRAGTRLALGTGADVQDVINAMRQTQGAFRFRGARADPNWIANQLHIVGQLGSLTQQQLATMYPRIAQQAALAGPRGFQQSAALFGALSRNMPVSQAASATQGFFRMLEQPSPQQMNRIVTLYQRTGGRENILRYFGRQGVQHYGLMGLVGALERAPGTPMQRDMALRALFPQVRGNTALMALMGGQRGGYESIMGALGSRRTQAAMGVQTPSQAYANYLRTSAAQMSRLREQTHLLSIDMGHIFIPMLNDAIPPLRSFVGFLAMIVSHRALTRFLVTTALVMGGLAIAIRGILFVARPLWGEGGIFIKGAGEAHNPFVSGLIGMKNAVWATGGAIKRMALNVADMSKALIRGGRQVIIWSATQVKSVATAAWSWAALRVRIIAVAVAQRVAAVATRAWTIMQAALNVVMSANPIGLVIIAIAALGVGIVVLYNKWKPFHDFVNAAWDRLKKFADWLSKAIPAAIGMVGNWIQQHWKTMLLVGLTGPIGLAIVAIRKFGPRLHDLGSHIAHSLISGIENFWMSHNPASWIGDKLSHIPNPFGGGGTAGPITGRGGGWGGRPSALGAAFGFGSTGFANSGVEAGNLAMYRSLGIPYHGTLLDWDYSGRSQRVRLPGTRATSYRFLRSLTIDDKRGHMGTAEFFSTPNGGVVQVNHMMGGSVPGFRQGQIVHGGQYIGMSGYSSGQFGAGYHLCVVTDDRGRTYLAALPSQQFGQAVANGRGISSRVARYNPIIRAAAMAERIPVAILSALIMQESSGDPGALSRAGAMGLTQLMPGTARTYGATNPYDPRQNVFAGARYLSSLYYGPAHRDWTLALAMYNAGPGNPGAADPRYAANILYMSGRGPARGGGGAAYGAGGPPTRASVAPMPGYKPPLTSPLPAPKPYVGEKYTDPRTGDTYVYTAIYDKQTGRYLRLTPVDVTRQRDVVGERIVVPGAGTAPARVYQVVQAYKIGPGGVHVPIPGQTRRVLISGRAGFQYQVGDIRYRAGRPYEEYERTQIRRGGRMVPGPPAWVRLDRPHAGDVQWVYTAHGYVEQRFQPTLGVGHMPVPSGAGRWVTVPMTTYTQHLQAQDRATRAHLQNLTRLYPARVPTANMTPREAQAWLRGRYQAINDERRLAINRLREERASGQLGNLTTRQYHKLVDDTRRSFNTSFASVREQLQNWQMGGPQTGMYHAYHIIRRDQCAAEAEANKIRDKQRAHQKAIEANTKKTAVSTQAMDDRLRAIHGLHLHQHRQATATSPHHKPTHIPLHHTPFNDPRFHGHHAHPSPTQ